MNSYDHNHSLNYERILHYLKKKMLLNDDVFKSVLCSSLGFKHIDEGK